MIPQATAGWHGMAICIQVGYKLVLMMFMIDRLLIWLYSLYYTD